MEFSFGRDLLVVFRCCGGVLAGEIICFWWNCLHKSGWICTKVDWCFSDLSGGFLPLCGGCQGIAGVFAMLCVFVVVVIVDYCINFLLDVSFVFFIL